MHDFVVFADYGSPKANTTNIHKINCAYYKRYLKQQTKGTTWQEESDISSAIELARRLHKQYGTNGIRFAGCCMEEYDDRNPVV